MKTASEMASWIAKAIENNSPETAAIIIMEEYNCNPYASNPSPVEYPEAIIANFQPTSPMSAEQVVKETGHDLINGALPYIEEHLPKKYIDTLAKYLDSYLDKVFSTTPSVKADGWVSVDKEKEFHKVLKCLKNNKVMVGTREDGIYIRLAGRESEGEAFTLHFALAYPFPKLPPHQNKNK